MKLGMKVSAVNIITVIIFLIVCGVLFSAMAKLADNQKWVIHTYEVISDADKMLASMVDQETGMRGFLVTGNDDYLEPYENGKKEFYILVDELKNTVNDNPVQVERLEKIEEEARNWDGEAASRFITIRRAIVQSDEYEKKINERMVNAVGKKKMDAFRAAISRSASGSRGENIILDMINMETGLRGFLVTGDEEFLEPYNAGRVSIASNLRALGNRSITTLAEDWIENYAEVQIDDKRNSMSYLKREDLNDALGENIGKKYMDGIRVDIAEFVAMESDLLVERNASAAAQRQYANFVTVIGAIFASILSIILSLIVTRSITRQLGGEPEEIADVALKIAEGDLNIEFPRKKLVGVYLSMQGMTEKLTRIVQEIILAANEVAKGSEQISSSAQSISSGTSEQASNMEEVSSSIEELNSNIQQNTDNAQQSNVMAKKVTVDSREGGEAVAETVNAMKNIAEKISVIEDIARSTNMLALNAAIEAARAGDAGKGFAVVASEVRKLAENSGEAAKDITEIAQNSVHRAVVAQEKIDEIVPAMGKTAELIEEITMASQEQNRGAEQINQAVVQLDSVVQQNASSSEELASMSEELLAQATQMKQTIGFFKVNGNYSQVVRQLPDVTAGTRSLQNGDNDSAVSSVFLPETDASEDPEFESF